MSVPIVNDEEGTLDHIPKRRKTEGHGANGVLLRNDISAATLFYEKYGKENVMIVDAKRGRGYEWDGCKRLWIAKTRTQWESTMSDFFVRWAEEQGIENESLLRMAGSHALCSRVWKFVASLCHNPDFERVVDSERDLLPVRGGCVVDLRTGLVTPRTRDHYFSTELDVNMLPEGDGLGHIEGWSKEVFGQGLSTFMQKVSGYLCTGRTDSATTLVLWGAGRNGKSAYCKLLRTVLGHFFTPVTKEVLTRRGCPRSEGALSKKRVVVSPEVGDIVLRKTPYLPKETDVVPMFKVILCTNNPEYGESNPVMVDRRMLVPLLNRFVDNPNDDEKKKDTALVESLCGEYRDEVFTWFVRGAVEWYKDPQFEGMPVHQTTRDRIEDIDPVGIFLKEKIERTDNPADRIACKTLYDSFQSWLAMSSYYGVRISIQKFSVRVKEEVAHISPKSKVTFLNIRLAPKTIQGEWSQ